MVHMALWAVFVLRLHLPSPISHLPSHETVHEVDVACGRNSTHAFCLSQDRRRTRNDFLLGLTRHCFGVTRDDFDMTRHVMTGPSDGGFLELDGCVRLHLHGRDRRLGGEQRRGRLLLGRQARPALAAGARRKGMYAHRSTNYFEVTWRDRWVGLRTQARPHAMW